MLGIVIIAIVCAFVTTTLIICEIHWSIQNLIRMFERNTGVLRIKAILLVPLCFMPVLLDVFITLGLAVLLGLGGMVGSMVSMVASSSIALYLFVQRRRYGWRYI